MDHYKILTTDRLRDVVAEGVRVGFNRTVDLGSLGFTAREDGLHLVCLRLPFHQAFDSSLPDHHRVDVMVNVEGSDEPEVIMIDIADRTYSTLPGMEVLKIGPLEGSSV